MKLADWAKKEGIDYRTAYRWFKSGKMPVPARQLPSGMIIVDPRPLHVNPETAVRSRAYVPSSAEFERLIDKWKKDTYAMSSTTMMVAHPSYQRIIGMGPAVLPLLTQVLKEDFGCHWCIAMMYITGEDPVSDAACRTTRGVRLSWLAWAREEGYLA